MGLGTRSVYSRHPGGDFLETVGKFQTELREVGLKCGRRNHLPQSRAAMERNDGGPPGAVLEQSAAVKFKNSHFTSGKKKVTWRGGGGRKKGQMPWRTTVDWSQSCMPYV